MSFSILWRDYCDFIAIVVQTFVLPAIVCNFTCDFYSYEISIFHCFLILLMRTFYSNLIFLFYFCGVFCPNHYFFFYDLNRMK